MYGQYFQESTGMAANPTSGQLNKEISSPRSRQRIWSRETGSAAPSRVSPLISTLRLNLIGWCSGIPPAFRDGVHI